MAVALAAGIACVPGPAAAQARRPAARKPAGYFTAKGPLEALRGKQAVIETGQGTIVIELLADAAPNHVAFFIEQAKGGAYDGTTFHRLVKYGIVQGGDPLSKDPARRAEYGTGGLGRLRFEPNDLEHTRGAVSAVLQPSSRDSAGAQFFICVTDQPALDGQFTVFGRVVEGIDVVQAISESPVDEDGKAVDRIVMRSVTIRDTPPPEPVPFAGTPVDTLAATRARLVTSLGTLTIAFDAEAAPGHVRNFLRLSELGVYDRTRFHRVVKGFVAQTGALDSREAPLTERQRKHIGTLQPEFGTTRHTRGIVSMARGDDPASASTSFFICLGDAPSLDGRYTVFGRVIEGLDVLEQFDALEVDGETPRQPVWLERVEIVTPPGAPPPGPEGPA